MDISDSKVVIIASAAIVGCMGSALWVLDKGPRHPILAAAACVGGGLVTAGVALYTKNQTDAQYQSVIKRNSDFQQRQ